MKHDARHGMNHGGERRDRQNIAGDLDGALFGGPLDFLNALGMRHWADVPNIAKDSASIVDEQRSKLAIIKPSTNDRSFEDFPRLHVEVKVGGRNVSLRALHADIALALLLRIVERMRVKEGPDKLPAHVFQAEFKMRVLIYGVVAAVEGGGTDIHALFVGDLLRSYETRRVTRTGRGDR